MKDCTITLNRESVLLLTDLVDRYIGQCQTRINLAQTGDDRDHNQGEKNHAQDVRKVLSDALHPGFRPLIEAPESTFASYDEWLAAGGL